MNVTIEMLGTAPGSYMPETKWLLYAENVPAPLCPEARWLLYGGR
jgi:hypothetical protein